MFILYSVVPLNMRLIFARSNRIIYQQYNFRNILEDYRHILIEKISKLESTFSQTHKETQFMLNKQFEPSKTAQNGLNFITKEDEISLANERINNDEVINIFKIIFILLKQNADKIDPAILPELLINRVFKKLKIDSLSKNYANYLLFARKSIFKCYMSQSVT